MAEDTESAANKAICSQELKEKAPAPVDTRSSRVSESDWLICEAA